jgi:hypothetical protein
VVSHFAAFTQASVQLQLACDEAKAALSTTLPQLHLDVSPSILISSGIELDDQRYVDPLDVNSCKLII